MIWKIKPQMHQHDKNYVTWYGPTLWPVQGPTIVIAWLHAVQLHIQSVYILTRLLSVTVLQRQQTQPEDISSRSNMVDHVEIAECLTINLLCSPPPPPTYIHAYVGKSTSQELIKPICSWHLLTQRSNVFGLIRPLFTNIPSLSLAPLWIKIKHHVTVKQCHEQRAARSKAAVRAAQMERLPKPYLDNQTCGKTT